MIKIDEDDPVGELEPSFPHRDVKIRRGVDLKEFYDVLTEIGRGKFGTVYKCKEKSTGLLLAAKFVPTARKEDRRNVEREIDIMRTLQHPRLIQLYDAFDKDKQMVVVLELIEGGELFERVIDDDFVLTEKSCTAFMRQICQGMEFIHQQNILHLDMKPENILCLTKTGNRIKIIDFGLARKYDPEKKLQVLFGTPEFVAPEVVNFDQIGFGTDMWSIGVICYVLLSGLSPFMGETDVETMANVTVAKWDFDDEAFLEISDDAKDFISNLLIKDKEKRLTATQCLAHPWLRRKPTVPVQKQPSAVKIEPPPSELDLAKDNLKFFVERWNEHPNSPYIFDTSCQTISPCVSFNNIPDHRSRTPSLSGYSPSPCDSISSLIDAEVSESPPVSPQKPFMIGSHRHSNEQSPLNMSPRNYFLDKLQLFDRRASDSSCMLRHNNDIASRINLVEEIKRLSDKLLKINNLQNNVNGDDETEFTFESDIDNNQLMFTSKTKISNKFSKFEKQTSSAADFSGGKSTFYYSTTSTKSTVLGPQNKSFLDSVTPKRKFKFMNRDVPLHVPTSTTESESLSDTTSSTLSSAGHSHPSTPDLPLETPDLARNILHLLGKYDEFSPKTELRRTSLSMDWSEVETLGQRTMKSLSNYLQTSKNSDPKRKTTSTGPKRLTARQCLRHKWLTEMQDEKQISITKLKRYVIKKRWIKAVNTIIALKRMGAKLDLEGP